MNENQENKLISIFQDTFGIEDIKTIKNLSRENYVKWDSLAVVSMIATISSKFSLEIEPNDFEMFTSFQKIKQLLKDKGI